MVLCSTTSEKSIAADKLTEIIQNFDKKNKVQNHENDDTVRALMKLSEIFQRRITKFKDGAKSPRVVQQHPPLKADSHLKTKNNVSDLLTKPLSPVHRIPTENATDMLTNGRKHRLWAPLI